MRICRRLPSNLTCFTDNLVLKHNLETICTVCTSLHYQLSWHRHDLHSLFIPALSAFLGQEYILANHYLLCIYRECLLHHWLLAAYQKDDKCLEYSLGCPINLSYRLCWKQSASRQRLYLFSLVIEQSILRPGHKKINLFFFFFNFSFISHIAMSRV